MNVGPKKISRQLNIDIQVKRVKLTAIFSGRYKYIVFKFNKRERFTLEEIQ